MYLLHGETQSKVARDRDVWGKLCLNVGCGFCLNVG